MTRSIVATAIVTLLIIAVQLSILSTLRVAGTVVMIVWLWPLALGLAGAVSLSLWAALACGVLFDTHAATHFGLSALVALALAYVASRLGKEGVGDIDSAAWWVTPAIAGVAGLAAPLTYVIGGVVWLDFSLWHDSVGPMMLVNALAFVVLARPFVRVARWSSGTQRVRR